MRLLTWHGTIIRLERTTGRLTHSKLVPVRDLAVDFVLALPSEGLIAPLAGPNDITLVPGEKPGTAHLQRLGLFLSVQTAPYPLFTATRPGQTETLLLLEDKAAERLRDLLSHRWIRSDTGKTILPSTMAITPGPVVSAGTLTLGVRALRPGRDADTLITPSCTLGRVPDSRVVPHEVALRGQGGAGTPDVADAAAFARQSPARLSVPASPEWAIPPLLGSLADRDFLYRRGRSGLQPASGRLQLQSQIVRKRDAYVLLERGVEGMILDERGVLNDADALAHLGGAQPPHFGREGDRYFIDQALLDSAPTLAGPHAVFYGGGNDGYYRWLIGAMVPLCLMAPYLPPGTTLLLPAELTRFRRKRIRTFDHLAILDAFGFGDMPRRKVAGQICRVEEVFWPDRCTIDRLAADALRAARERAWARQPEATGPRMRLYVRRAGTRAVANADGVETLLGKHGFLPVLMEELTIAQQIDLFRRADIIVAAHGGALANLIFCQPGTQVIELSPDCQYRPTFNEMSAKLGLTHAVLPCVTDDGTFDGRLVVHGPRLMGLLGLLMSRRAA